MGKRSKGATKGDTVSVPAPLTSQIATEALAKDRRVPRQKNKRKRDAAPEDERLALEEQFVSQKLSDKIIREATKQQLELSAEFAEDRLEDTKKLKLDDRLKKPSVSFVNEHRPDSDEDEEEQDYDGQDEVEEIELDADTEAAFNKFLHSSKKTEEDKPITLFDLIQEKIDEKRTEVASQFSAPEDVQIRELDPRFIAMYQGVRDVLSTYRSGRLPKAFKIIPKFVNWEQVLSITEPDRWTAAAMFAATRIFVSNLNADMCQKLVTFLYVQLSGFLNLVLLPRIRDDIGEYKRLNFHLYQALHKALFKPAAFFKGILIPLSESSTCTLREATIFSSVLAKCSIPMLHSAAAMLKIAEMNYSGANSMFLRALLDKKYTLPYRVIDGIVGHFIRFTHDKRELPVLWHQALLVFVQRYKSDLSTEQREALHQLLKAQSHHQITPEIRRELEHVQPRDEEAIDYAMET